MNNPYNTRIIDIPLTVRKLRLTYSPHSTTDQVHPHVENWKIQTCQVSTLRCNSFVKADPWCSVNPSCISELLENIRGTKVCDDRKGIGTARRLSVRDYHRNASNNTFIPPQTNFFELIIEDKLVQLSL